MSVDVNLFAVFLAALSSMAVGAFWYSPAGFYKPWVKMAGIKHNPALMTKQHMTFLYVSTFVASLVTAFVLAHVAFLSHAYFKHSFLQDSLTTAVWLWLGLTAARVYVHDAFEARRKKLTLLTTGHELVTLVVMALVIGAMGY